jgi:hypothetical protein
MSNDLTSRNETPLWMRQKSTGAPLGNLSADDMKPPEVKLLQATSPEAAEQPGARAGEFWLTGRNLNLGPEIVATPIILKKTYVIWNPTKSADNRVPMAVASDGIHWDIPNQELTVYYPNNPKPYIWKTKRTVAESRLDQFGSSRPEDPRSTPAASMTYQMLWAFNLPDGRPQLGVITNSRTGIKPMKELFGMIDGYKPVDHYFLRFRICAVRLSVRPGEYFFGYKYYSEGQLGDDEEALGDSYKALHDRFRKAGFSVAMADEADEKPTKSFEQTRDESLDNDEIQY